MPANTKQPLERWAAGAADFHKNLWRRDPESNRARRICNPLHNRFAIAPKPTILYHLLAILRARPRGLPDGLAQCFKTRRPTSTHHALRPGFLEHGMELHINASRPTVEAGWREERLVWVLREALGLVGSRFGWGAGLCGACTVLVNGQPQ